MASSRPTKKHKPEFETGGRFGYSGFKKYEDFGYATSIKYERDILKSAPSRITVRRENRLLDLEEWHAHRDDFIETVNKLVWTEDNQLNIDNMVAIRSMTLRHTDASFDLVPTQDMEQFASTWVIPPQDKAHKRCLFKTFLGVDTKHNLKYDIPLNMGKFTPPGSIASCLPRTVQELIRTERDASRVIPALHNIIIAAIPVASTRSKIWTSLRKLTSVYSRSWYKSVFVDGHFLSDPNTTSVQKGVSHQRNVIKQLNPVPIELTDVVKLAKRGRRRWVDQKEDAVLHWADAAVWLLLLCGARKTELLFYSNFCTVSTDDDVETLTDVRRIVDPGWIPVNWIKQSKLSEKRTSSGKPELKVIKPLLCGSADEFLSVLSDVRQGFMKHMGLNTADDMASVTKGQAGSASDIQMTAAFKRSHEAKDGLPLLMGEFSTGQRFKLHTLRAVYGHASFLLYGPRRGSLLLWIGSVLGHDLTNGSETALFYMSVSVYRGNILRDQTFESKYRSALAGMEDLEKRASALLTRLEKRDTGMVKLWSDRDECYVFVDRLCIRGDGRAAAELATINKLRELGVLLKHRTLRSVGLGSKQICLYMRSFKSP